MSLMVMVVVLIVLGRTFFGMIQSLKKLVARNFLVSPGSVTNANFP